jgi:hypothetical protein
MPLLGAHETPQVLVQIVDGVDGRPDVEHQRFLPRSVAEIGIERGDEFLLAPQKGFLEFNEVVPTLFQRRGTIAQEGSALKRKRAVQGAICARGLRRVVRGVHRGFLPLGSDHGSKRCRGPDPDCCQADKGSQGARHEHIGEGVAGLVGVGLECGHGIHRGILSRLGLT